MKDPLLMKRIQGEDVDWEEIFPNHICDNKIHIYLECMKTQEYKNQTRQNSKWVKSMKRFH